MEFLPRRSIVASLAFVSLLGVGCAWRETPLARLTYTFFNLVRLPGAR